MAHNINFNENTGRYAFASAIEVPWHKLGQVLDHVMTSEEAIREAGLNYIVDKTPVLGEFNNYENELSEYKVLPKKYLTYRTDTNDLFDVVSDRYEIIQNEKAFEFFDSIVGKGQAIYETAGALGNGETIFVSVKFPSHIRVLNTNDVIENYCMLTNSHNGKQSLTVIFTPIRVVCNNTLSMALANCTNKVKVRHNASTEFKLKEGESILGLYNTYSKNMNNVFDQMAKVKYPINDYLFDVLLDNDEALLAKEQNYLYVDEISTYKKNLITSCVEYYHTGRGQELDICKGTVYGAFQAVNGFLNNGKYYRSEEEKFEQLINGQSAKINQTAMDVAMSLI